MRERPIDKPSPWEVLLVLLFILMAMALGGKLDYQDALERENRALRADAARCRMIQALRDESPSSVMGRESGAAMGRETP